MSMSLSGGFRVRQPLDYNIFQKMYSFLLIEWKCMSAVRRTCYRSSEISFHLVKEAYPSLTHTPFFYLSAKLLISKNLFRKISRIVAITTPRFFLPCLALTKKLKFKFAQFHEWCPSWIGHHDTSLFFVELDAEKSRFLILQNFGNGGHIGLAIMTARLFSRKQRLHSFFCIPNRQDLH